MKRVVTGRGSDGRDTITHESAVDPVAGMPGSTNQTRLCWAMPMAVTLPADGSDPVAAGIMSMPAPGEARFVLVTFAPNSASPVHVTPTVDCVAVVAGELWLVMEDGSEALIVAGDAVVQNGTLHAWQNRSDQPCTIAATMIGATLPATNRAS